MNAAEQAVMVTAHESWERKRQLHTQIHDAVGELAENVYQEYFAIRGCSRAASYEEARREIRLLMARIEDTGTLEVYRTHIGGQS